MKIIGSSQHQCTCMAMHLQRTWSQASCFWEARSFFKCYICQLNYLDLLLGYTSFCKRQLIVAAGLVSLAVLACLNVSLSISRETTWLTTANTKQWIRIKLSWWVKYSECIAFEISITVFVYVITGSLGINASKVIFDIYKDKSD